MILNDLWIKDNLFIIAGHNEERLVNPASLDLRWSGRFRRPKKYFHNRWIQAFNKESYMGIWDEIQNVDEVRIHPGELLLLDTVELITIPTNVSGVLMLKSSMGRIGLEHLHAGFFDPGFRGTATLEITNKAPWHIILQKNQPIVQMVFYETHEPLKDYSQTGRYQNQNEPQESK